MANSTMFYTVQHGDVLSEIAQRHGTTSKQLCKINGIKNKNHIEPGQIIALNAKAVCKVKVQVLDRDRNAIKAAKVRLDYNGKKKKLSSDDKGWLSTILTKTPDDKVKIAIERADGTWKQITEVTSGWGNKIVTLVSPKIKVEGKTMPHPKDSTGKPVRDAKKPVKPPEKPKTAKTSNKPTWNHGDGKAPKMEQKKDKKGLPLQTVSNEPRTVIKPENGLVPWMNYALGEAKRFKGAKEDVITKTINYHKEIGVGLKTLVGDGNPWCASFANWCLKQAGYPIANPRSLGVDDRRAVADGFRQVHKGKKSLSNPLFIQIPEPVYGAIAVVVLPKGVRDERPGKHVGFVYGRSSKTHICVLGGNQSDTICFTDTREKETIKTVILKDKKTKKIKKSTHLEYYLPALYYPTYQKNDKPLTSVNSSTENKIIGITKKGKDTDR